jgi:D-alanyl-D-alanine carboxypeptidase
MKKFYIRILIFSIYFLSCKKDEPDVIPSDTSPTVSSFTFSTNDDGLASFNNSSKNGVTFEWDFGDGKGRSVDKDPVYHYSKSGAYIVSLKTNGKTSSNTITDTVEIKIIQNDLLAVDAKINSLMEKYQIVGATLAVSKNGKLVYNKGYGFSDKENKIKVTPENIFRIASVTKTYTGVAIMKLIQEGKINIDDKVFGNGGILGNEYGTLPLKGNILKITVNHLLHHTSGAWGSLTGIDVIDYNTNFSTKQFYDWVIDTRPMPKEPGTFYDYSNINYHLLGRIIEKVGKKSYLNFLKEEVLGSYGGNVDLASTTLQQRKPNEVKYYGLGTDNSYLYNILFSRRDADGGLITTSKDLLKFCLTIDGLNSYPDVLDSKTFSLFTTPSSVYRNYGCGLGVWGEQNVLFSYGSLPGCRSGAMWGKNGMVVALIFNTRLPSEASNNNDFIYAKQDLLLDLIYNKDYYWQNINLF